MKTSSLTADQIEGTDEGKAERAVPAEADAHPRPMPQAVVEDLKKAPCSRGPGLALI